MTKQDFQLIADVLNSYVGQYECGEDVTPYDLTQHLADALATTNPRFDRARFLKACGVDA